MFLTALAWKRLMQGRDGLSLYGRVNNAMETLFCCHTVHVSRSQIPRSPVADPFSSHLLCPPPVPWCHVCAKQKQGVPWPEVRGELVESRGGFLEAPDSFCRGEDVSCSSARVPGKCHPFPPPSDCALEHTAPSDSPKFTLQALQHSHKLGGRLFLCHLFCHLLWHSTSQRATHGFHSHMW